MKTKCQHCNISYYSKDLFIWINWRRNSSRYCKCKGRECRWMHVRVASYGEQLE